VLCRVFAPRLGTTQANTGNHFGCGWHKYPNSEKDDAQRLSAHRRHEESRKHGPLLLEASFRMGFLGLAAIGLPRGASAPAGTHLLEAQPRLNVVVVCVAVGADAVSVTH
jgi:hypothetical protein